MSAQTGVEVFIETREMTARRRLTLIATIAYAVGFFARYYWIFCVHPPGNPENITSDAKMYVDLGKLIFDPHYVGAIIDTANPPGCAFFLAVTYLFDPTLQLATAIQFLSALLLPILVGAIGEELFGWRVGRLGLLFASLYYPFVDQAGYFMADAMFMTLITLGFWLLLRSLRAETALHTIKWALLTGVACGMAIAFKGQGIISGFLVALYLAYVGWRLRWKRIALVQLTAVGGLLLILVPMSVHQTRLNEGHLCIVSTNGAANFLIGHTPGSREFVFDDKVRGWCYTIRPPFGGNFTYDRFDFGIYETQKIMDVAWKRINENKLQALGLSFVNVFHLFGGMPLWPSCDTVSRGIMIVSQYIFTVVILLPVLVFLFKRRRALLRLQGESVSDVLLMCPLIGICITAFLITSEPRYRIAFDGFFLLLAARFYTGGKTEGENVFSKITRS